VIEIETHEVKGSYRLGVIPTVAPYFLPLFLPLFSREYPKVQLTIEEDLTDSLIQKLKLDQLDGGILATPVSHLGLQETSLYFEPFQVYLSKHHSLLSVDRISPQKLNDSFLWMLKDGHCFGAQSLEICQRTGRSSKKGTIEFASGNLTTLKGLVDQGLGLTLMPDLAVRAFFSSKDRERVRSFVSPVPVREVRWARSRIFAKKRIFDALSETARKVIPSELMSPPAKSTILQTTSTL
jgi:LysR family hydrogen peroxide-inducible transcriptional activator